jgi:hypothetical protein
MKLPIVSDIHGNWPALRAVMEAEPEADRTLCLGDLVNRFGGSRIGSSRVKLANVKDCLKRHLIAEGQDPRKAAADQLVKDRVDVLHTIGSDDTNTAAADLAANLEDLRLIKSCADLAVECALRREAGVIGHDEEQGGVLRAIEFPRVNGGKPFNIDTPWFEQLLNEIGQPKGGRIGARHGTIREPLGPSRRAPVAASCAMAPRNACLRAPGFLC